jgi:hypothetical protein
MRKIKNYGGHQVRNLLLAKLNKKITIIAMLFFATHTIAQQKPLQIIEKGDYAELTQREKELYVTGLLEGQAFLLYGSKSPDLKNFSECVKAEGVKTITFAADTAALFYDFNSPMPWAISRAVGSVCKKYR